MGVGSHSQRSNLLSHTGQTQTPVLLSGTSAPVCVRLKAISLPLSSSCSNGWGWLPGLVRVDSYSHHRTVGLRQRLMCCNGKLKARQDRQQGSRQQKVFAGSGTWAAIVISYALKLAGLLRSPRALCRNVRGWKAGEDWRFGKPTSLLLLLPPSAGPPPSLRALSLLRSTPPPRSADHDHAACSDLVTKCPPLV